MTDPLLSQTNSLFQTSTTVLWKTGVWSCTEKMCFYGTLRATQFTRSFTWLRLSGTSSHIRCCGRLTDTEIVPSSTGWVMARPKHVGWKLRASKIPPRLTTLWTNNRANAPHPKLSAGCCPDNFHPCRFHSKIVGNSFDTCAYQHVRFKARITWIGRNLFRSAWCIVRYW